MPLILDVPFSDKDEAKALGAFWNPDLKKWYVKNKYDYPKFKKWILNNNEQVYIICDCFYVIAGKHICFKCKKETIVIGFGIENFYEITDEPILENEKFHNYYSGEIHIANELSPIPQGLHQYLSDHFNYYKSFSKTTKSEYYANHCQHCGIIQGNYFLFEEEDSPFFVDSKNTAEKLTLYKIPLRFDQIMEFDCSFGSEDYLIKKYGTIIDLDIDTGYEGFSKY